LAKITRRMLLICI